MFGIIGDVVGGLLGSSAQKRSDKANLAFANELNRNKIRWTVDDAKAAGIHPLAALGSPVAGSWAQHTSSPNTHVAEGISRAGRGYQAYRDRQSAQQMAQDRFNLEKRETESRIALNNATAASRVMSANSQRGAVNPFHTTPKESLVAEFGYYDKNNNWVRTHYGLNPSAFEIGVGELATGSLLHGVQKAGDLAFNTIGEAMDYINKVQPQRIITTPLPPAPTSGRATSTGHSDRAMY
jgi:hypothetical protein